MQGIGSRPRYMRCQPVLRGRNGVAGTAGSTASPCRLSFGENGIEQDLRVDRQPALARRQIGDASAGAGFPEQS